MAENKLSSLFNELAATMHSKVNLEYRIRPKLQNVAIANALQLDSTGTTVTLTFNLLT